MAKDTTAMALKQNSHLGCLFKEANLKMMLMTTKIKLNHISQTDLQLNISD